MGEEVTTTSNTQTDQAASTKDNTDNDTVVLETDTILRLTDNATDDLKNRGDFNGRKVLEAAVEEARKAIQTADPDTNQFVHEIKDTAEISIHTLATLRANTEINLSSNAFADQANEAQVETVISTADTALPPQPQG